MFADSINVLNLSMRRLAHTNERQRLLAQNVANADTPYYRRVDLKPFNLEGELAPSDRAAASVPMRTNPAHLVGARDGAAFARDARARGWETSIAGNGVVIEEEMAKATQNQLDAQTAMTVYRKTVGLLKTAIGRSG